MNYKRVLLKLSGEAFTQKNAECLDPQATQMLVREIASVVKQNKGMQLAIVLGGGNIFRGGKLNKQFHMDQAAADSVGMLGTIINAIILKEELAYQKIESRVLSALLAGGEHYTRERALEHLSLGRIVLCAGGTGNPYFTTDTAAALRALELGCDVILKATKVDGVYSADPARSPDAKRYATLTYTEALENNLEVMDAAALSLCRDHKLPTIVFNFFEPGNLAKVLAGKPIGTTITP